MPRGGKKRSTELRIVSWVYDALAPMPRKASELNQSILPFLSFSFFLFSFLSLYPRPQEEKTPRVQRVHLPFRDAYCTLDDAIYRSWGITWPTACCIALIRRRTPRFTWNATTLPIHVTDRLPRYGFSKSPA